MNFKGDIIREGFFKYLFIIILAFILGRFIINYSFKYVLFLIIGLSTAGICLLSIKYVICLLIILITAVPTGALGRVVGVEMAAKNIYVFEIIYILILLSWVIQILLKRIRLPEFRKHFPMYLFFLYILITALLDLMVNNQPQNLFMGARRFLYYGLYFVVVSEIEDLKDVKKIMNSIVIGSLLYASLFISMYLWRANPIWQFLAYSYISEGADRVAFGNGMISFIGLCLLVTRWLISPSGKERLYSVIFIFPLLIQLIMQQWRAGWIAFFIYLLLLFIYLIRKHQLIVNRAILSTIVYIFVSVVILTILHFGFSYKGTTRLTIIKDRIYTVKNIKTDSSLIWRYAKIKDQTPKILDNLFFGGGFSTYHFDIESGQYYKGVSFDESHTPILRMMGVVGYAIFIIIFIRFFKKIRYIYRYSKEYISNEYSITFMSLFPVFLLFSITSRYLTAYDQIFVIAAIFALAEVIADRVEEAI